MPDYKPGGRLCTFITYLMLRSLNYDLQEEETETQFVKLV